MAWQGILQLAEGGEALQAENEGILVLLQLGSPGVEIPDIIR